MMKLAIAAATAALFATSAQAGDHAYIQANIGSFGSDLSECTTSWTDGSGNVVATYSSADGTADCNRTKGPTGKLLAGYRLTPNFALEATYWKFGKEYSIDPVGQLSTKISAFGLGGALSFDISDRWSVIGRLGWAKIKTILGSQINGQAYVEGDSDSHSKYYAGGGMAYAINSVLKLHGDFDYTKTRSGSPVTGGYVTKHGIRMLSAGASVNF